MILDKIVEYKKEELAHFKHRLPLRELKDRVRDVRAPRSLHDALVKPVQEFAVIAEIKYKSPSKGILREHFDPVAIARDYADHGAAALSVLTDEHFFGGHLDHLRKVRRAVELPLLRKDFIWDAYQIYAGLEAGADAILLIAAILEKSRLEDLQGLAKELGLSVLFEIHDKKECDLAVALKAPMVGVNNRDLRTFKVDVAVSEQLFPHLPESVVKVSESGINSRQVMQRLKKSGANAFLIGESLMTAKRPGEALEELFRRA